MSTSLVNMNATLASTRGCLASSSRPVTARFLKPVVHRRHAVGVVCDARRGAGNVNVVSVEEKPKTEEKVAMDSAPTTSSRPKGRVIEDENLTSTTTHRIIVGTGGALALALFAHGWDQVDDLPTIIGAATMTGLAYIMSDVGSGIYHWAVDNYGSEVNMGMCCVGTAFLQSVATAGNLRGLMVFSEP